MQNFIQSRQSALRLLFLCQEDQSSVEELHALKNAAGNQISAFLNVTFVVARELPLLVGDTSGH